MMAMQKVTSVAFNPRGGCLYMVGTRINSLNTGAAASKAKDDAEPSTSKSTRNHFPLR